MSERETVVKALAFDERERHLKEWLRTHPAEVEGFGREANGSLRTWANDLKRDAFRSGWRKAQQIALAARDAELAAVTARFSALARVLIGDDPDTPAHEWVRLLAEWAADNPADDEEDPMAFADMVNAALTLARQARDALAPPPASPVAAKAGGRGCADAASLGKPCDAFLYDGGPHSHCCARCLHDAACHKERP